jgi:hypothetical protein
MQLCILHDRTTQRSSHAERTNRANKSHLEWLLAKVYNIFMRPEMLGRPEALVAVGFFASERSVCLWQVRSYMSLQVGFAKIRLVAFGAYKRALNEKMISATIPK